MYTNWRNRNAIHIGEGSTKRSADLGDGAKPGKIPKTVPLFTIKSVTTEDYGA